MDIAEMSTETLRKLQDFVRTYRKAQGLPVEEAEEQPQDEDPELDDDDVQLAGEEDDFVPEPTSNRSKKRERSSPEKKKKKKEKKEKKEASSKKPAKNSSGRRIYDEVATMPQTQDELKDLAEQTKMNTDHAIQELKDELKRMSGKVVDKDHREKLTDSIGNSHVISLLSV